MFRLPPRRMVGANKTYSIRSINTAEGRAGSRTENEQGDAALDAGPDHELETVEMSRNAIEPVLWRNAELSEPEVVSVPCGEVAAFSRAAPGKLATNEDSAGVIPLQGGGVLLVVADGMGGGAAGEVASRMVIECLAATLAEMEAAAVADNADERPADIRRRAAILNGIERANREIQDLNVGAGSTITAVEFVDQAARPYHVGDSLAMAVGNRGKVRMQTIAHSPVAYAVEAGLLDEQEAMHHADRHLVSNIAGMADMRVEIGSFTNLLQRDTLLLASDGVSDNLHPDEIVQAIRKGSLKQAASNLAEAAWRRMTLRREQEPSKPDDLTFLLFRQRK